MKVKTIKPFHDLQNKVHYVSPREFGLSKVNVRDGEPNKVVGEIIDNLTASRAKVLVENGFAVYVDEIAKVKKPKATKTNLKKVK